MNHRAVLALQERRGSLHAPLPPTDAMLTQRCNVFQDLCSSLSLITSSGVDSILRVIESYRTYVLLRMVDMFAIRIPETPATTLPPLLQRRRRLLGLFSNAEVKRGINIH